MEMGILRWGLVVYVLASTILVCLLWRSAGAENSFSQIGALFGGLALAFVAIAPSLRQDEEHSVTTLTLFRDTEKNTLLFGPFNGPYVRQFEKVTGKFGYGGQNGTEVQVPPEQEIELIEYAIVQAVADQMRGAWTAKIIDKPTIYGSSENGQLFIGLADEKDIWSSERFKSEFTSNSLIKKYGLVNDEIIFPPKMLVEHSNMGQLGSTISLIVEDFQIDIIIGGKQGGTINEDIWGLLRLDHNFEKPTRYEMNSYLVFVRAKTAKFNRYPRLIKDYWTWYGNVASAVGRLDWSITDKKLLDDHMRSLLWKGGPGVMERAQEQSKIKQQKQNPPQLPTNLQ